MTETTTQPLSRRLLTQLQKIETTRLHFDSALIGFATRLLFASVLLRYFWSSALTKLDGFGLSLNAYAQIFPRQMEAAGYDVSALGPLAHVIVAAGTFAEILLPLLVVIGLFTRLSALAMIGFVIVMTLTDIIGHGVGQPTIGLPFDRFPDALIADQRLIWVWMLAILALTGGGYVSADRALSRR
jgi:Predicted membrane protein